MSASPEFYRPSPPAFSPSCAAVTGTTEVHDYSCCRTPTPGLREPVTCPPAPRKPRPVACRKLLFDPDHHHQLISMRLDDLERLFRPITNSPQLHLHHSNNHQPTRT